MAKGRKTYRSMRGKAVDMDLLMKKNELTPAVGNAKVNARGDRLGPGGQIVKKREDLIKEYYDQVGSVKQSSGKPAPTPTDEVQEPVAEEKPAKKTTKKVEPKVELTTEEQEMFNEAEAQDEWIEDADGNFVRKGE
jgi:hypothetical protein